MCVAVAFVVVIFAFFFFLKFETTQLSTGMLIVGPAEEYRMIVASSSDAFLHFFKEII